MVSFFLCLSKLLISKIPFDIILNGISSVPVAQIGRKLSLRRPLDHNRSLNLGAKCIRIAAIGNA